MTGNRVRGLFITGTDTGVGKTRVTALMARQLAAAGRRVGVYKPAASGCRAEADDLVSDDAVALWEACGRTGELEKVCPQRFAAPVAPHLAARVQAEELDLKLLRTGLDYWTQRSQIVLVEGPGGLMCPLGDEEYVADLAYEFGYPLVVVARDALGTINHTLLTLVAAATFRKGLDVAGIVLNQVTPTADASVPANRRELEARCVPPVLGRLDWGAASLDRPVDWWALAR